MKTITTIAMLLAIAAWISLVLTFSNLLSGNLEERTCLTDCVKNYYFATAGIGALAALFGLTTWVRAQFAAWGFVTLMVSAIPFGIVSGIFIIGTVTSMPH